MFFNLDSIFTENHSHFNAHKCPPTPTPAPTQFGEWQLERSGNPPLFRVASSAETQLPGQWESAPRQSVGGGPSQLDPHVLGGMWMLAKVTSTSGFKRKKKIWRSTGCLCTLSKGCSAESWGAVNGPRWAEGLAFYKDLSIKVRPASLSLCLLWWVSPGPTHLPGAR